ncbi:MAG: SEL1-like repeat protein [Acidobacteriota bacterium]|nr:SEL1-like repeat protein [Acidobacteriota bacterium]
MRSQFPSIKLDQLVYVELESSNGGMMLTVSEQGFSFRAVSPVRAISRTAFSFVINGTQRLEGFGKIDWTKDDGKVAGLQFTDVTTDFLNALRLWLTQSRAPAAPLSNSYPGTDSPAYVFYGPPADDPNKRNGDQFSVAGDAPVEQAVLDRATVEQPPSEPPRKAASQALPELKLNFGLPLLDDKRMSHGARVGAHEFSSAPASVLWNYPAAPAPSRSSGLAITAAAVCLAVLAVLLYSYREALGQSLISLGQKMSSTSETSQSEPPKATEAPKPAEEPRPQSPSMAPALGSQGNSQTSGSVTDGRYSAPVGPTTKPDSTFQDARPGSSVPAGTWKDDSASRDPQDQVRALWSAVSQGNTAAEVALARLYLIGGGVPKSCDQAKVLLQAAAKKGNGEAIEKLNQISRQGCP